MKFNLPQNIKFVLDTIKKHGHKVYIVGGCVRDLLSGKTPHDFDVTTSALPGEIMAMFEKTAETGIKHGTVTVIVDSIPVEVTTFRIEAGYSDARRPDQVNFVDDVRYDLARRDFTVNAMCYNEDEGLIDCFGGADDIKNRILRAVGEPSVRFSEDALRILRLFRFSATLVFEIEENTLCAALENAHLLEKVSAERIQSELSRAVMGDNSAVLAPLLCSGALKKYALSGDKVEKISLLKQNNDLRLFTLFYLTSTNLGKTLQLLKCSNRFKDYAEKMQYFCKHQIGCDRLQIKKAMNFAGSDIVADAFEYYKTVLQIDIDAHKKALASIISKKEPYLTEHLQISGKDIEALGFSGKAIGEKLDYLLERVIEQPKLNKKEILIELLCN